MTFKKGDKVTFEYGNGCNHPRIDLGHDNGASGIFGDGEIASVDEDGFTILYTPLPITSTSKMKSWEFIFEDDNKPGYPTKKVISPEEKKNINALHTWFNNSGE